MSLAEFDAWLNHLDPDAPGWTPGTVWDPHHPDGTTDVNLLWSDLMAEPPRVSDAAGVKSAMFRLGSVMFDPLLHPRDDEGRFAETLSDLLPEPPTNPIKASDVINDAGLTPRERQVAAAIGGAMQALILGADPGAMTEDLPAMRSQLVPATVMDDSKDHGDDLMDALTTALGLMAERKARLGDGLRDEEADLMARVGEHVFALYDGEPLTPDAEKDLASAVEYANGRRALNRSNGWITGPWHLVLAVDDLNRWAKTRSPARNPYTPKGGFPPVPDPGTPVVDGWTRTSDPDMLARLAAEMYDSPALAPYAPGKRQDLIRGFLNSSPDRNEYRMAGADVTVTVIGPVRDRLTEPMLTRLLRQAATVHSATGLPLHIDVEDDYFQATPSCLGVTGRGTSYVKINPMMVEKPADAGGTHLLGSYHGTDPDVTMDPLAYVILHEAGHTTDRTPAGSSTDLWRRGPRDDIMGNTDLSPYGNMNEREAYAEAFALWVATGGKTSNPTVRAFAERYNWSSLYTDGREVAA